MNAQEQPLGNLAKRLASLSVTERREFLERLAEGDANLQPVSSPTLPPELRQTSDSREHQQRTVVTKALWEGENSGSASEYKTRIQRFYDAISGQLNASGHGQYALFLTYGYATASQPDRSRVTLPKYCLNKNCIQLVCELIGDCPLEGRRVLDIGCGRGGTIYVLNTYFSPDRTVGLELSAQAVAFCRRNHKDKCTLFVQGDAESLPFGDAEFDAVTNVESSHSYPDLDQFYREVHRVLRDGGHFLYTDLLPGERWETALQTLGALGFAIEVARDITENVQLSCDQTGRVHAQAFDPGNDAELMGDFLALQDSGVYGAMKRRVLSYRIYRLSKGGPPNSSRA